MNIKTLSDKYGKEVAYTTAIYLNKKYKTTDLDVSCAMGADIGKSGFFKPKYFLTTVLSSTSKDSHSQRMSARFLEKISKLPKDIHLLAGEEHFKDMRSVSTRSEQTYKNGKLYVKVYLDKASEFFKDVKKSLKKGISKVSIEIKNATINTSTNTIIDGQVLGFRLVKKGSNKDAKVLTHNL